ncbi:MAG TPA: threonine synthase [Geobacterales bacterium]|nr:threonine synthase [Geobacterales bacterium]
MIIDDGELRCINCGSRFEPDPYLFNCKKCNGLLEYNKDLHINWSEIASRTTRVWKYRELLPRIENPISLDEGGTPMIRSNIFKNAFIKFEGANPTGSFKDRGMTVAISVAKESGAKSVIVASTGNTASSAAAYAARAGLNCYIFLPMNSVAKGKLAQVALHGAKIFEIEGNFDDALKIVMELTKEKKLYPLNSFNPWRLEGQKTISFEIFDQLGIPDWVIVPVGNAGNISAIWKGFKELKQLGLTDKLPKMIGVQAEGSAPIANAWLSNQSSPKFIDSPITVATAIRIGKPVNWPKAWNTVKESKGTFLTVSDEEILEAQKLLARIDGIGSEPAGAASMAGLRKLIDQGLIKNDEKVVLIVTGHALKDPESAMQDFNITKIRKDEKIIL